jgi:hypothetical protein
MLPFKSKNTNNGRKTKAAASGAEARFSSGKRLTSLKDPRLEVTSSEDENEVERPRMEATIPITTKRGFKAMVELHKLPIGRDPMQMELMYTVQVHRPGQFNDEGEEN